MKKGLLILLLIMYGISSSGMTVHFHYCCGELKTIDLTPPQSKDCPKKMVMAEAKRCCDNKEVSLKISGEQETIKAFRALASHDAIAPAPTGYDEPGPFKNKRLVPEVFAPPPLLSPPLFLLLCVFRI